MISKTATLVLPIPLSAPRLLLVFIGLSVLSFSIPFALGHPQWLVGTIVNVSLFLSAVFLPKKFILPLVVLPSLAIFSRGVIFGPLTMFLVYFLPFIWLANLVLIFSFKKSFTKLPFLFSLVLAAIVKFFFLFAVANIYFKFSLVPSIFIQSMGLAQLMTALAGGLMAWIIFKAYAKNKPGYQTTA